VPIFTVPIHEHGDPDRPGPYPHGKGGGGGPEKPVRSDSEVRAALKQAFKATEDRNRTVFLLPDGTRISRTPLTSGPLKVPIFHSEIARHLGLPLDRLLQAGIVRYVPHEGIDTQSPITDAQADIIASDFAIWRKPIYVDARAGPTDEHSLKLFDWRDVTPSLLRSWVNARVTPKRKAA
jgi:hypothetical protein